MANFMAKPKKKLDRKYLQLDMKIGNDRYRVDDLFGDNGLVVTYKGYDTFRKRFVVIRELFPGAIVDRNIDQEYQVFCKKLSDESVFLAMKEHMLAKAKKLIQLYPVKGIANVLTSFEERDTVYVVEEFVEGQSMKDFYYKRHSVKFAVEDVMKIMGPVMDTLSYLHSKGLVHGTVYPDHIYITPKREIVLTGITSPIEDVAYEVLGAPPIRKDEFSPVELFLQQAEKEKTIDVYEVAAIFYRYVTGEPLPAYYLRINENDEQTEHPIDMKLMIMDHQAEAIMKALSIYSFDRYQSIEEFKEALWPEDVLPILEKDVGIRYQSQKPFWYAFNERERKKYYAGLVIAGIIILMVLVPAVGGVIHKGRVTHFYKKIVGAPLEEQCSQLLNLDKNARLNYTNDYVDMDKKLSDEEKSEQFVAKYYDMIIGRYISQEELTRNESKKVYEYVRIDYRQNEIWLMHIGNEQYKDILIDRNPNADGSFNVTVTTRDEQGNDKKENVLVKP